jgi:uncharacterized oligopeptide transporter (OPT) family protein
MRRQLCVCYFDAYNAANVYESNIVQTFAVATEIITKFLLQGGVICLPNGRHTNKYRCIAIINKTKADVNAVT